MCNLLLVLLEGPSVVDKTFVVIFGGALALHCWICKIYTFCSHFWHCLSNVSLSFFNLQFSALSFLHLALYDVSAPHICFTKSTDAEPHAITDATGEGGCELAASSAWRSSLKACLASVSACERSDMVQATEGELGLNQIGYGHDVNMYVCLHACTSIYAILLQCLCCLLLSLCILVPVVVLLSLSCRLVSCMSICILVSAGVFLCRM